MTDSTRGKVPDPTLYEDMIIAIHRYIEQGNPEPGLTVNGMVMVLHLGSRDYPDRASLRYALEAWPMQTPVHAIKGLLNEGSDLAFEIQHDLLGDDEDDDDE